MTRCPVSFLGCSILGELARDGSGSLHLVSETLPHTSSFADCVVCLSLRHVTAWVWLSLSLGCTPSDFCSLWRCGEQPHSEVGDSDERRFVTAAGCGAA